MEQGHDSRLQSQHPFPHNQTSFPPPAQNRAQFSVSTHPQSTPQPYINQNRRQSDPYYDQQRSYGQDAHSLNHARHQIGAPINHGVAAHLSIPSLQSQQHHSQSGPHPNYAPPLSRVPTGSVGVAVGFPGNRDHTALPPMSGSRAGGIAIADILGGPSANESIMPYNSPAKTRGPIFDSTPTSPRVNKSGPDYPPYQRSKTPEYVRKIDIRDNRVNPVESPSGTDHYKTLESQRYDTPQQIHQPYLQRGIPHKERKDTARKINVNGPTRPNSQPINYNVPQPPNPDRTQMHLTNVVSRRVDPTKQQKDSSSYGRPTCEEIERQKSYNFLERDRIREQQQEREAAMKHDRERDKKEQRMPADHDNNNQRDYAMQASQRKVWYSRPPEPRDWMQNGTYDLPHPAYEPIPDREGPPPRHLVNNYEYSVPPAPQFTGQPIFASNDHRNGPAGSLPPQSNNMIELARHERQGPSQQLTSFSVTPQNGSYPSHESHGRKPMEEIQSVQQRNFLGIQELNRKRQVSPLPQSALTAQSQADGPAGEPSIKNEFGRMFSGIGSGVGSTLQAPSPTTGQSFPVISGLRREELETFQELQRIYEPQAAATQGSKRRKTQEDRVDDENPIGRNSPNRRVKRTKTNPHQKQRLVDSVESNCSSQQSALPLTTPNSTLNSSQQSDDNNNTNSHHHVASRHNHHNLSESKGPVSLLISPNNNIIPLPKLSILNDAVLTSVANQPRHHLGYGYYGSTLKPSSYPLSFNRDFGSSCGFTSTPDALPLFVGRENCTYTVKIPRIYLEDFVREEVTSRKAIWGTDIYTDDSDVLAACIHSGWFRGAWPEDVDVSLLGLELKTNENGDSMPPDEIQENQLLESPSEMGPSHIPPGCDCHVTILILPLLDRYASSTRFGIKSREWGIERKGWKGKHDGLSFMIKSVRFVSGVDGEQGRSGRSRCNILRKQLQEKEANWEDIQWMNYHRIEKDGSCQIDLESDMSRKECFIGVKGLGMGGWWKKYNGAKSSTEENIARKLKSPENNGAQSYFPGDTGSKLSTSPVVEDPSRAVTSPFLPTHDTLKSLQRRNIISQITETMRRNSNYAVSTELAAEKFPT